MENENLNSDENNNRPLRRSSRICKPSERYGGVVAHQFHCDLRFNSALC